MRQSAILVEVLSFIFSIQIVFAGSIGKLQSRFLYETPSQNAFILIDCSAQKISVLFRRTRKAVDLSVPEVNFCKNLQHMSLNLDLGGQLIISPLSSSIGQLRLTENDDFIPLNRRSLNPNDADIKGFKPLKIQLPKLRTLLIPRNFKALLKDRKMRIAHSFVSRSGLFLMVMTASSTGRSSEQFLFHKGLAFSIPTNSFAGGPEPMMQAITENLGSQQTFAINLNRISVEPLRLDAVKWTGFHLNMQQLRSLFLSEFPVWHLIAACQGAH